MDDNLDDGENMAKRKAHSDGWSDAGGSKRSRSEKSTGRAVYSSERREHREDMRKIRTSKAATAAKEAKRRATRTKEKEKQREITPGTQRRRKGGRKT